MTARRVCGDIDDTDTVVFLDGPAPSWSAVEAAPPRDKRPLLLVWLAVAVVVAAIAVVRITGTTRQPTPVPEWHRHRPVADAIDCLAKGTCELKLSTARVVVSAFRQVLGQPPTAVFTATRPTVTGAPFLYAREIFAQVPDGQILVQIRRPRQPQGIKLMRHTAADRSVVMRRGNPFFIVTLQWVGPRSEPVARGRLVRLLYDNRLEVL